MNRQQLNKYINGHSRPTLTTLRRLCDFFGVEDHEILLSYDEFSSLVKVRPPRLGYKKNHLEETVGGLVETTDYSKEFLERHEGYYFAYIHAGAAPGYFMRTLYHLYQQDGNWFSKSMDRTLRSSLTLPPVIKYSGIVTEGFDRIVIHERERGMGRALLSTYLHGSTQSVPSYLPGLLVSVSPEVPHEINCHRTIWEYLGKTPNLREAVGRCGVIDQGVETLDDMILYSIDNQTMQDDGGLKPRF